MTMAKRHIVYGWNCSDLHIELEQKMFCSEKHNITLNDDGTVEVEGNDGTWFTTFTHAKREAIKSMQLLKVHVQRVLIDLKAVRKDEL